MGEWRNARGSRQWGYLVTTIIGLVLCARLLMAPLWFWTLQTLQPLIPGAMCLTGVHMAVFPTAFIASGAQFFVPMAYLYWLTLHALDRHLPTQPFYRLKFFCLIPVLLLLLVESALDLHVLTAIHPMHVNCCSSLFVTPTTGLTRVLDHTNWEWTLAFALLSAGALGAALLLRTSRRALLGWGTLLLTPVALLVFAIALHSQISPVLLHTPSHHCVFCLWQNSPLALLATAGYVLGIWLLGATAITSLGLARLPAAPARAENPPGAAEQSADGQAMRESITMPAALARIDVSRRRLALLSFWLLLLGAGAMLIAVLANLKGA